MLDLVSETKIPLLEKIVSIHLQKKVLDKKIKKYL